MTTTTAPTVLMKRITYFGQPAVVACDGQCDKAWGLQNRPRVHLARDGEHYAYLADHELGFAPSDPGTYEGEDAKPTIRPMTGELMNKWCVRECERCEFIRLPDFSQRLYNKPSAPPPSPREAEGGGG